MKISPFVLFCIILIVLVIFALLGNTNYVNDVDEGFLQFQESAETNASLTIPHYSPTSLVNKLYDQLFYDQNNGNLIEVVSPNDPTLNSNVDLIGNTITSLIVTNRRGTSNLYTSIVLTGNVNVTADSLNSTVQNNIYSWSYPSQTTETDAYNVFYIPWYDSTYIYMLNKTKNVQLGAWLFGPAKTTQQWICTSANNTIGITKYVPDTDPANNTLVSDTFYDPAKKLYQISRNVKFDFKNGNLLIQSVVVTSSGTSKTLNILDRNGTKQAPITAANTVTNTSSTINSVLFTPFTVLDSDGQNLVVYMPSATRTVIALITLNSSGQYILANVCRFNSGGHDIGDGYADDEYDDEHGYADGENVNDYGNDNNDYGNDKYDYGNRRRPNRNGHSANINNQYWKPDDYMLKTQIVPPVCPTCPACPACPDFPKTTTCTNCGGNGGSGTLSSNGNSSVGGVFNSAGNVVNNTVDAAGNVVNNTVDTAGNIVNNTVDAAGNIIGNTALGAGLLVGGVASGVGNVVGGLESGIGGVATGIGNAVGGLLQNNNQRQGQITYNNVPMILGTQNQYTDNYSYYGQLPAKQSTDFMPVTTSFSAFGK